MEEFFLEQKKIKRISELTQISRERELTAEEQKEREALRKEYIESIKRNFRGTLENIKFKDEENK